MIKSVEHLEINGIIMHRDIKHSNFIYDMNKKMGILIEYGLSELILNINGKPVKNYENANIKKIAQQ